MSALSMLLKRSWCEIHLNTITQNYFAYKNCIPQELSVIAVIKADAYGRGAVPISTLLQQQRVTDFAVSNLNEAIELREAGIEGQILILGYTPVEMAEEIFKYDITQSLLSEELLMT